MQKWEYTVTVYDTSEETLNELGSEGWELIAVVSDDIGNLKRFFFKRPLEEPS